MRLVDADDLEKRLHEMALIEWNQRVATSWSDAFLECEDMVYDTQTVDAVEVLRCKDCVYCKHFNDVWYSPKRDELLCTLYVETYHTTENDYCSRGERR